MEAYALLARFTVAGHVYNVRHQPIAVPTVTLNPASPWTTSQPSGGFTAFVVTPGAYTVTASRPDFFGPLPPMVDVTVNDNVSGLEFILPPKDDIVTSGGFEGTDLVPWQLGGTTMPTLTPTAHTGHGAVKFGQLGADSSLSQVVTPASSLTNPTLSFIVRLETAGPPTTLQIRLASADVFSPPAIYNLPISSSAWTHVWYGLPDLVNEPLTITFTVSDDPAILMDEVSLGSSLKGVQPLYLPLIHRAW
jgi:hypothetical protein